MTYRPLTLREAEFVAHKYALQEMNSDGEPLPPFNMRLPGRLESCLAEPFQTFDGKYLHYRFVDRMALLFYLVAKNHCFSNGNKRMAVTLTMVTCYVNKKWITINPRSLYEMAILVAESPAHDKNIVVKALVEAFKKYMKDA